MKVSFILGAGFSFNAGLPMVSGVSEKFLQRPLDQFTLNFNSGEWKWTTWASEPDLHNGILSMQHIPIATILEKLMDHFLTERMEALLNYEEFYQYALDMSHNDTQRFESIVAEAQAAYKIRFNFLDYDFDSIPESEIFSCFYHLIDDLLYVRKPFEDVQQLYTPYIKYLTDKRNEFNIYTLNHDLLMESLFKKNDISYADGFSTNNKILLDDSKNKIPVYDGSFGESINLIKLHGSIDTYQYRYNQEKNRHKGYDYFKTMDFHAKHGAIDVDEHGEVVQNWTIRITPQFITGQNKQQIINEDKMYSELYAHLKSNLPQSERLIVVGYSFMDDHINRVIESSISSIREVIHVNPNLRFPFQHPNIREVNPVNEQIIL